MTTELIGFYISGRLHINPVIVLGYFRFRFKSWDGFYTIILAPICPLESLGARGIAAVSKY